MAEPTPSFGLPLEYQSEVDALQRRRQIAQMLLQQAMQPQQTQMMGPIAVRQSPIAGLARGLAGAYGGYKESQIPKELSGIRSRAETEGVEELTRLQGMQDPRQRITTGMASRFPGIRTQAQAWQKAYDERTNKAADVLKDDPQASLDVLRTGQLPETYKPTPLPKPEEVTLPSGARGVLEQDRKGQWQFKYEPKAGASQTVNIGADEKEAIQFHAAQIKTRQEAAKASRGALDGIQRAVMALERGAQAGGGENFKQALRKGAEFFGVNLPDTASTEDLGMAMGEAMLGRLAALRPASNQDILTLEKIVGQIRTNPEALAQALSFGGAVAIRELQNYNKYMDEASGSLKEGPVRSLFAGGKTGYEVPDKLTMPENFLVNMMENLDRLGGDAKPYGFVLTGQSDTNPQIRGKPAREREAAANQKPPGMSDRDWKELQELRKGQQR